MRSLQESHIARIYTNLPVAQLFNEITKLLFFTWKSYPTQYLLDGY